jgi:uncharacterized ion transporter superfamily protein YfcC
MDAKAGAQISRKAFIQSVVILFVLMMVAGILTHIVPAGQYDRLIEDGREVISPDSFEYTSTPDYPVWRWFTAPFEVPFAQDGLIVIMIILFLLMVGGLLPSSIRVEF